MCCSTDTNIKEKYFIECFSITAFFFLQSINSLMGQFSRKHYHIDLNNNFGMHFIIDLYIRGKLLLGVQLILSGSCIWLFFSY